MDKLTTDMSTTNVPCPCQDSTVFLNTAPCYVHTELVGDDSGSAENTKRRRKDKTPSKKQPGQCLTPVGASEEFTLLCFVIVRQSESKSYVG